MGVPQLVIFDLDGTLTDSAEGIVASFLHALSHVGAP
ncbi:MAG TPA: HAD hydrolase-like protein, partial [Mycobacterium sp.]|nr:HAD hydrolase-like protein [Mycobacterium sp.]